AVLRAPDSLDAPIKAAVKLENDYADAMLAPSKPLQQELIARMEALDALAGAPVEIRSGDYLYYERTAPGSDYPVYLRRPIKGGPEQVLL
ncbi:S9 family peptidase, partial [Acinetobacter baumannii]|nr:S9 family peptidase [Acinetobacter baumannii]